MKAKKFISAVSALAMTASAMATCVSVSAAGEEVILKGDQIESAAGAKFTLNISIDELNGAATQGFSGCEFAIEYDPSKITIEKGGVSAGPVFNKEATSAELQMAPSIKDEVTMINGDDYNCFDYNIVKGEKKNTIAVLWCTGLESSKYWASKTGTIVTLNGTVSADAKEGDKIPVKIVPITRDGNDNMVFGYVDGTKDKVYSSAVAQDGLITIGKSPEKNPIVPDYDSLVPLWGDVNDNGSVTSADLVAMIRFMLDPEEANLTYQGIVNGNLYQADGNKDLTSDSILGAYDLVYLKKLLLEDIETDAFPITK